MTPYEHHVLVCVSNRPPLVGPSCSANGSMDILMAIQEAVEKQGLREQVLVTGSTCLGPCEEGVNVVVYPESVWYRNVTRADVDELVREHLLGSRPVERLRQRFTS